MTMAFILSTIITLTMRRSGARAPSVGKSVANRQKTVVLCIPSIRLGNSFCPFVRAEPTTKSSFVKIPSLFYRETCRCYTRFIRQKRPGIYWIVKRETFERTENLAMVIMPSSGNEENAVQTVSLTKFVNILACRYNSPPKIPFNCMFQDLVSRVLKSSRATLKI